MSDVRSEAMIRVGWYTNRTNPDNKCFVLLYTNGLVSFTGPSTKFQKVEVIYDDEFIKYWRKE